MKTVKKIIGVILSALLVASVAVLPATGVTDKELSQTSATDYNLADNVQDGVILHAWNWSYNTIKENLDTIAQSGYTTVQTSPVQQPKIDQLSWWDVGGQWWKLYQPLSFSIAQTSWLGTKEELKALCEEADKYGIKIICDIVSNHMANDNEGTAGTYFEGIANYESEIYNNTTEYFHQLKSFTNDSAVDKTVQGSLDGVPDLNTGNKYIQERVISLLKECVDCGVDGFRFDAAKHIETPDDGEFASDYWPTILNAATEYAKTTTGQELYYYGEVLNSPGTGRSIDSYTKYMSVTDNMTGNTIRSYVNKKNAQSSARSTYFKGSDPSKYVLWAESHDTYMADDGSSASVTDENIAKTWALVGSRLDATALYFARPGKALMGDVGSTGWKSVAVSEINKFHNAFVGQSESVSSDGDIAYVERGTNGVVLVNVAGTVADVSVPVKQMADGDYTDAITGNAFTVAGGKISGSIGDTGIAVVYNTTTTPYTTVSVESSEFKGETLKVTVGTVNASNGTYQIDGGEAVSFVGSTEVELGADTAYDGEIKLVVTASDGTKTTSNTYTYVKRKASNSGVFAYFNNTGMGYKNVYCYVYDEDTNPDADAVTNASWPGEEMTLDEETGLYKYEIPENLVNVQANVIFNDNNGKQVPAQNAKATLPIRDKSMIYSSSKWKEYGASESSFILGDANLDGSIKINDVTQIQRSLASIVSLDTEATKAADVNGDGKIAIGDATLIQKYLANIETDYPIGQPTSGSDIVVKGKTFYVVAGTGYIFKDGAKIWIYNNDTKEAIETEKQSPLDDSSKYSVTELPETWKNISIYRTKFDVAELDIENVLNQWHPKPYDGKTNSIYLRDSGRSSYRDYTPES